MMAPLFLKDYAEIGLTHFYGYPPIVALGLVLAVYPLGQFLGAPLLGRLADKLGAKRALLLSLLGGMCGFVFSVGALEVKSALLFIASRFFTGFWEDHLGLVRSSVAHMKLPSYGRDQVYGAINTSVTAGFLLGPLVGGYLSDNTISPHFNHKIPFIAAILLSAFAWLMLVMFFKNPSKSTVPDPSSVEGETPKASVHRLFDMGTISHSMRALMVVTFLSTLSFDTFYEFYPVLLVQKWGFEEAAIAQATLLLTVAMVISQVFLVRLMKSWSMRFKIVGSGVVLSSALLMMSFSSSAWATLAWFPVVGMGIGMLGVYLPLLVSERSQHMPQGFIMGRLMALRYLGDAGVALVGTLLAHENAVLPLALSCAFVVLGTMAFMIKFKDASRI
jgi:MFS family permease